MISEARIALAVSLLAVSVSIWQAIEARRANTINSEDLQIEVSHASPAYMTCNKLVESVPIIWKVIVGNNSIQPALLKNIRTADVSALLSAKGREPAWELTKIESIPTTVAAKGYLIRKEPKPSQAPGLIAQSQTFEQQVQHQFSQENLMNFGLAAWSRCHLARSA